MPDDVRETLFRHTARGREALASPGQGGSHVHYQPRRSVGLGCITSRRHQPPTFFEVLAFELGVHIDEARRRWLAGEIR